MTKRIYAQVPWQAAQAAAKKHGWADVHVFLMNKLDAYARDAMGATVIAGSLDMLHISDTDGGPYYRAEAEYA